MGPLLGSVISASLGFSGVFLITPLFIISNFFLVQRNTKNIKKIQSNK